MPCKGVTEGTAGCKCLNAITNDGTCCGWKQELSQDLSSCVDLPCDECACSDCFRSCPLAADKDESCLLGCNDDECMMCLE